MENSTHPKIFVLDTNVILHDSSCITQFQDNDVVIPITVLEELDNFKKGNEAIHFHAREFLRKIDRISGDALFEDGVHIDPDHPDNCGKLSIALPHSNLPKVDESFDQEKPDHRILNIAYQLKHRFEETGRTVVLLSKDVNLRMKAKAVGLKAQNYVTDHVQNIDTLYKGYRLLDNLDHDIIETLYQNSEIPVSTLTLETPLRANENVILRNSRISCLGHYNPEEEKIENIKKTSVFGISPRNAQQTFAFHILQKTDIPLISITGRAGTGKTLLALASALHQQKMYRQIFLARPIIPLSNRDIGYLPGEIKSKLDPYMQPLYDNLGVIQGQEHSSLNAQTLKRMMDDEKLQISALAYIRGRSLNHTFFIVDEAQNLTPHEVKTIITRAGEGSKIVFTGDIFQIDHPYLDTQSNGLSHLIEKMQGHHLYAHINLEKGERSELAELASQLL